VELGRLNENAARDKAALKEILEMGRNNNSEKEENEKENEVDLDDASKMIDSVKNIIKLK